MKIESPNFKDNEYIPQRYSCEGEDINPALQFIGVPKSAQSLALIMHDPDAPLEGGFTHWLIWNIEPDTKIIQENSVPLGVILGQNSSGMKGYRGPCPPAGLEHHYQFEAFALDIKLEIGEEGIDRTALLKAIEGHIIEQTQIIGLYKRE